MYRLSNSHSLSRPSRLTLVGLLLLGVSHVPGVHQSLDQLRRSATLVADQIIMVPQQQGSVLWESMTLSHVRADKVSALEQENRQLYMELATCHQASGSAQVSKDASIQETHISFSGGQWIILLGALDTVHESDVVLQDGVVLGKVESVHAAYSTIDLVQNIHVPLLLTHEKSKTPGVLRMEGKELLIQFSTKIDTLQTGDMLLLVPDGEHARVQYPVALIGTVTSTASDSVSTATVQPLTRASIGGRVQVVRSVAENL